MNLPKIDWKKVLQSHLFHDLMLWLIIITLSFLLVFFAAKADMFDEANFIYNESRQTVDTVADTFSIVADLFVDEDMMPLVHNFIEHFILFALPLFTIRYAILFLRRERKETK